MQTQSVLYQHAKPVAYRIVSVTSPFDRKLMTLVMVAPDAPIETPGRCADIAGEPDNSLGGR